MKLNYDKAFVEGRTVKTDYGITVYRIHQIGDLVIPTGFIIACDPFVNFDSFAFKTQIPVGTFPVILSVANFGDDQRVAYAKLQISDKPAIRWELALLPNQDINLLEKGEVFGYPVDAGTGSFMDAETARIFSDKADEDFADFMIKEMEKNYVHTWDWANFKFEETVGNLITFKSGFGDGVYASYFGFDQNDEITCLVTDFALFEDQEVYSEE